LKKYIVHLHGCQTTLRRLLEDWRNALEKNQYVAAVLRDLSKTFDCLPHAILLDKLSAYGTSTDSVSLLESYFSNRKQQIKINSILSSWSVNQLIRTFDSDSKTEVSTLKSG
jgi:hypothetical protein